MSAIFCLALTLKLIFLYVSVLFVSGLVKTPFQPFKPTTQNKTKKDTNQVILTTSLDEDADDLSPGEIDEDEVRNLL